MRLGKVFLFVAILLASCSFASAQSLDRGHKVLLDRGLQIAALAFPGWNIIFIGNNNSR